MAANPEFDFIIEQPRPDLRVVSSEPSLKQFKEFFDEQHGQYMTQLALVGGEPEPPVAVPMWEEAYRQEMTHEKPDSGGFELFFKAGHARYLAEIALAEYGEHLHLKDKNAWEKHVLELMWLNWSHRHGTPEIAPVDYMDVIAARRNIVKALAYTTGK